MVVIRKSRLIIPPKENYAIDYPLPAQFLRPSMLRSQMCPSTPYAFVKMWLSVEERVAHRMSFVIARDDFDVT